MTVQSHKVTFSGSQGFLLSARLDKPFGTIRAYALFAHCFTCSSQTLAAKYIAAELAMLGIAVLRFDFTGLGSSGGDFANTNFTSNVQDLEAAADYLRQYHAAPALLIGHSLGGAAVLAAAKNVPEATGIVTIGAPADAEHVIHNFGASIDDIERDGESEVTLAGRKFTVQKQFLDDVKASSLEEDIANLHRGLLVLHSPVDQIVGVENATQIFTAAKHPKSFISLDKADHLLSNREDASYAARVISGWASHYLKPEKPQEHKAVENVIVSETGEGKFQNFVSAGRHNLMADEPISVGGLDSGLSPYDFLSAALGSCTSMTIRMYAEFRKIELGTVTVEVSHTKVHADDCLDCAVEQSAGGGKIDRFDRRITIDGELPDDIKKKILKIANKCPVHRTLEKGASVITEVVRSEILYDES